MARRASISEPPFGSDSFLDVTTNMVGVLIIFIVLVGLRAVKAPPQALLTATKAAIDHRLDAARDEVDQLRLERGALAHRLEVARGGLSAKAAAVQRLAARTQEIIQSVNQLTEQLQDHESDFQSQDLELALARSRLVTLADDVEQLKTNMSTPRELVYHTPLSRPIESEEIHFEVRGGHITFVDLAGLMDRAKGKAKGMEDDLRRYGQASAEAGPVGTFRLRFTMLREEMPFTQSLLYGNGSFRARLVEWEAVPIALERGEPVNLAIRPGSQWTAALARHPASKSAVTLWVYSDSFAAFRQIRDHLNQQGYAVAARPLPLGVSIRGSVNGSRSYVQ